MNGPEAPRAQPTGPGELFRAFTRLALQGFGGVLGVAHRELVERRGWWTAQGFAGDWALAQLLPGPNVCNLALMFGWRHFGWRGAAAALGGLLLAPTLLLVALAMAVAGVLHWPAVQGAIAGMGAVAAGLVAGAGLKLAAPWRQHPLSPAGAAAVCAAGLAAVLLWRLPLALAVLLVGLPAAGLTWWRLGARP